MDFRTSLRVIGYSAVPIVALTLICELDSLEAAVVVGLGMCAGLLLMAHEDRTAKEATK